MMAATICAGRMSEPPACSFGAKPPPVGAKKVWGRPGDFLERPKAITHRSKDSRPQRGRMLTTGAMRAYGASIAPYASRPGGAFALHPSPFPLPR